MSYSVAKKYTHTGVISGGGLSINVDPTKYDRAALTAVLVDPATGQEKYVNFSEKTGITATYLTTAAGTFLAVDENDADQQQVTEFTKGQLVDWIRIGRLGHFALVQQPSNITGVSLAKPTGSSGDYDLAFVFSATTLSWNGGTAIDVSGGGGFTLSDGSGNTIRAFVYVPDLPGSDQTDLDRSVTVGVITGTFDFPFSVETDQVFANWVMQQGTIKTYGHEVVPNSTDLSLKRLAGQCIRIGAGATRDIIDFPETAESAGFTFIPAWNNPEDDTAILGPSGTQIDTTHYDAGNGVLRALNSTFYTVLYCYFFPSKSAQTIFMIHGKSQHRTLTGAIETAGGDDFFVPEDIRGGVLLAAICIRKGTTNLTQAVIDGTAKILKTSSEGQVINKPVTPFVSGVSKFDNNTLTTDFTGVPANGRLFINVTTAAGSVLEKITVANDGVMTVESDREVTLGVSGNYFMEPDSGSDKQLRVCTGVLYGTEYTVTFDNTTNKVLETGHSRSNGDSLSFKYSPGTLPAELRKDACYYVVNAGANDYQLAWTPGGAAITFTDDGSGTNKYRVGKQMQGFSGRITATNGSAKDAVPHAEDIFNFGDKIVALVYYEGTLTPATGIDVIGGGLLIL